MVSVEVVARQLMAKQSQFGSSFISPSSDICTHSEGKIGWPVYPSSQTSYYELRATFIFLLTRDHMQLAGALSCEVFPNYNRVPSEGGTCVVVVYGSEIWFGVLLTSPVTCNAANELMMRQLSIV